MGQIKPLSFTVMYIFSAQDGEVYFLTFPQRKQKNILNSLKQGFLRKLTSIPISWLYFIQFCQARALILGRRGKKDTELSSPVLEAGPPPAQGSSLCGCPGAAIVNYHNQVTQNYKHLFSHCFKGQRSEIKVSMGPENSRGGDFLISSSSWGLLVSLACGCIPPLSASVVT